MTNPGRVLKIYRDGRRFERVSTRQLPPGAKGNLATMDEMRKIIVEDSQEEDLKNFALREIIRLDKKTFSEQLKAAYQYCNKGISYEQEKDGFETVADLWSCRYALNPLYPVGDCAVKTISLATLLSFIGVRQMWLVAIGQIENVDFYNHVFLRALINGAMQTLDPTPENFNIGDELPSVREFVLSVF